MQKRLQYLHLWNCSVDTIYAAPCLKDLNGCPSIWSAGFRAGLLLQKSLRMLPHLVRLDSLCHVGLHGSPRFVPHAMFSGKLSTAGLLPFHSIWYQRCRGLPSASLPPPATDIIRSASNSESYSCVLACPKRRREDASERATTDDEGRRGRPASRLTMSHGH